MSHQKNFAELINRVPKLPTLPGVAVKILEAVKKDDLSLKELGDIISADPALSSEVLKLINSSLFSLQREVTSVNHAVNLLGLNTVRNLALSFSLVKNFKQTGNTSFDYEAYWKESIIGAITTRLLAQQFQPTFAEDAFFLGLLHNIGLLAFSQAMPDQYNLIIRETSLSSCTWYEAENKILGFDHTQFGQYLVDSWGMPETFSLPMRYHHCPEELETANKDIENITRILHLSSHLVDFLSRSGKDPLLLGLIEARAQEYGFAEELNLEEMTNTIQEQVQEICPLFEVRSTAEENYFQLIDEARKELIRLSSSFLNSLLEQKKQIEELNRKTVNDSLTGLINYDCFNETLEKEIYRCLRHDLPLCLIFADIDHFKKVNDTWGHLAGDHVLKAVANCLKNGLRDSDAAARYGGEEFAIILPKTNLFNAQPIAERLRTSVEQLRPEFDGIPIPVTMSFGVSAFSAEVDTTKNDFIKKADQALYRAKDRGRNRCCVYETIPN